MKHKLQKALKKKSSVVGSGLERESTLQGYVERFSKKIGIVEILKASGSRGFHPFFVKCCKTSLLRSHKHMD